MTGTQNGFIRAIASPAPLPQRGHFQLRHAGLARLGGGFAVLNMNFHQRVADQRFHDHPQAAALHRHRPGPVREAQEIHPAAGLELHVVQQVIQKPLHVAGGVRHGKTHLRPPAAIHKRPVFGGFVAGPGGHPQYLVDAVAVAHRSGPLSGSCGSWRGGSGASQRG